MKTTKLLLGLAVLGTIAYTPVSYADTVSCETKINALVSEFLPVASELAGVSINPTIKFKNDYAENGLLGVASFREGWVQFDYELCRRSVSQAAFTVAHELGHVIDFKMRPKVYANFTITKVIAESVADDFAGKIIKATNNFESVISLFKTKCEVSSDDDSMYSSCARVNRLNAS